MYLHSSLFILKHKEIFAKNLKYYNLHSSLFILKQVLPTPLQFIYYTNKSCRSTYFFDIFVKTKIFKLQNPNFISI